MELEQLERLSMMLADHPKVISTIDTAMAFELIPGQCLLVTGRSGSGKSTVANILAGLEIPDSFTTPYQLLINGIPMRTEQTQAWHKQIGYLTQQNSIIAATLYSNLTLGLDEVDEQQLWQALTLVELDDWAKQLPAGLHSWLGDTGSQLSGGQARRLCLARLLLKESKLILLDEPFNGIDAEMAQRIWQRLSPLWQDKMLIVLMHQRPDYFPELDNQQIFEINLDQS
ncbi:MAG: ATP-binding cassette domain-containing protein [Methylophaga nitratireducenticrescens]|nr:MAG: ATP-binding cassette domain-containing protein [Methylophaga nitratireducenticrescens]